MPPVKDLTGLKFGRLTVLEQAGRESCGGVLWKCLCECGSEAVVSSGNLQRGNTSSCGCLQRELISKRTTKDLSGCRFGRLTVLKRLSGIGEDKVMWLCQCDCGNQVAVHGGRLTSGNTRSCGCLQQDIRSAAHKKHGCRKDRLYAVWKNMRSRCNNKNSNTYKDYGGRGISVCPEWDDYLAFKEWAVANGYDPTAKKYLCTIDRIDNDKGYSPDNCRFVDMKAQANNRRPRKRK